jgi:hypothetical protein
MHAKPLRRRRSIWVPKLNHSGLFRVASTHLLNRSVGVSKLADGVSRHRWLRGKGGGAERGGGGRGDRLCKGARRRVTVAVVGGDDSSSRV